MLMSIASTAWSYAPGDVADVDDVEAQLWIDAGIAVAAERAPEAAVVDVPETATAEPQRSRRKRRRA